MLTNFDHYFNFKLGRFAAKQVVESPSSWQISLGQVSVFD